MHSCSGGHHHGGGSSDRSLIVAIGLNALLTIAQVAGGLISGSLSLLADALHNLGDAASLVVALVARRVARRPADQRHTFGYRRAEVIGAVINLTALIVVAFYLIVEAGMRFFAPQAIDGWIVIWVSALALAVDLGTAALTYAQSKHSINMRAAFLHNVSDALGSVAVMAAGAMILLFEAYWTDLAATLLIAAYVMLHGSRAMRSAVRILLESVPDGLSLAEVSLAIQDFDGVKGVHHLHVWQLDEARRALEAHVVLDSHEVEAAPLKAALRRLLIARFQIDHTTLELEYPGEQPGCTTDVAHFACYEAADH